MNTSRRNFIKSASAFGAFNLVPASVLHGATAPSNQLTRALIGFGGIARSENHLGYKFSRLVGVCDPFAYRVQQGLSLAEKAGWGKIKAYENFMKLLEDPGVDIVHICTPPHWHGVQSVMAAKAGKDIWCEKPMTNTVGEGKRVMEVVRREKRMFRLNTWFRFKDPFYGFGTPVKPIRQVVENNLVSGPGEPIRCVFGQGQGFTWKFHWSGLVNAPQDQIPEGFDYEMWLGPAPRRPYTHHRVSRGFRGYWDYSAGGLGDMSQHYLDPLQYLLCKDDTSPVKIDYEGPKQHPEAVGSFDRLTLTYADGTVVILDGNGSLKDEPFLKGTRASVWPVKLADGSVRVWTTVEEGKDQMFRMVSSEGKELDVRKILKDLPEPAPQVTDFMESVRTRQPFALNETNGFRSSAMVSLAVAAWRLGRSFEFDPVSLHAKNDPAAERFLYASMREPWASEMYLD